MQVFTPLSVPCGKEQNVRKRHKASIWSDEFGLFGIDFSLLFCFFEAHVLLCKGFPGGLAVKNLPANAGDVGLIPGSMGEGVPWTQEPGGL